MSDQARVLFICRQNSGRSQIAEAYLKKLAGDRIHMDESCLFFLELCRLHDKEADTGQKISFEELRQLVEMIKCC